MSWWKNIKWTEMIEKDASTFKHFLWMAEDKNNNWTGYLLINSMKEV